MTEFEAALLAEVTGCRHALDRLASAVQIIAAPAPDPETGCQHPVDRRIDFGTTNGQPDWQCAVCGFRADTSAKVA